MWNVELSASVPEKEKYNTGELNHFLVLEKEKHSNRRAEPFSGPGEGETKTGELNHFLVPEKEKQKKES